MWMAYIEEIPIVDLNSAIQYLHQTFSNLSFDAYHESNYGMGRFYTMEECIQLGEKYDKGEEACSKCLSNEIGLIEFGNQLQNAGLGNYLYHIKEHLPEGVRQRFCPDGDDEDDDDDDDKDNEDRNADEEQTNLVQGNDGEIATNEDNT